MREGEGKGGEGVLKSRSTDHHFVFNSRNGIHQITTYLFRLPKTLIIRSLSCRVISGQLAILDKV